MRTTDEKGREMNSKGSQVREAAGQLYLIDPAELEGGRGRRRELAVKDQSPDRDASALADFELIALLLDSPGDGLAEARQLLEDNRGLAELVARNNGGNLQHALPTRRAAKLRAALELSCRIAQAGILDRELLDRPAVVANYLFMRYARDAQEIFGALYLDVRNRLISEAEIFRGAHDRMAVEPAPILRQALQVGAAGFILFHNHPSQDPSPSPEDIEFTSRARDAGKLLGIRLVDHIILGAPGVWESLQRRDPW